MSYEIVIKRAAEKALDRLPKSTRKRILDALEDLRNDPRPRGSVKLSGEEDIWRIRVGVWRIVYEIHDDRLLILVVGIAHRKDVYRR